MNSLTFTDDQIFEMQAKLNEISEDTDKKAALGIINQFFHIVFRHSLTGPSSPIASVQTLSKQSHVDTLKQLIDSRARFFESFIVNFEDSLYNSSYTFGIWDRNWQKICERRSSIEFFFENFNTEKINSLREEVEMPEIDDKLKEWADKEGGLKEDQIPRNIPESHWWWFAN
jgi:hypothetical protein